MAASTGKLTDLVSKLCSWLMAVSRVLADAQVLMASPQPMLALEEALLLQVSIFDWLRMMAVVVA
jgi:hypothetical protein